MKTSFGVRAIPFLAILMLALVAVPAIALAVPTVNLGTTAGFAILAGSTITNTGPTTITGDVGLHPGPDFVDTGVTLIGARHITDAVANTAKTDLVTAYNDAVGRPVTGTQPVDLVGLTLGPGVYNTTGAGAIELSGVLTLDAGGDPDAVFIFKSSSSLLTASGSEVRLINGARFCRVFWVVPSSATLETNSIFVGHIFALADINVRTGATVEGQLLARTGQVTLQSNVITNEICAPARAIRVTKAASPKSLPNGPGTVTYTYEVTNPGTIEISNVNLTDNKISSVNYVSGDTGGDGLLQPGETWVYTATDRLTETTTNIATVTGTGVSATTTDTASLTVVLGGSGEVLPDTAAPWYGILLAGVILMLLGAVGWYKNRING